MSIASVQRHVEDKARVVWDGYLRSKLATESIPGVSDRIGALRIAVGLDPSELPGDVMIDTLPRVDLFATSAMGEYDVAGTTMTAFFTYSVTGIACYDETDESDSARSAQWLSSSAAEVLEHYLRDQGGAGGSIWRVDITSPVSTQVGVYDLAESRVHTMIGTTEITIYTRADFSDSPTYADPTINPGQPMLFAQLADITSGLDGPTGVGVASANRLTTWTTTTAALAGATTVDVDMAPAFGWVAGSAVSIYLQRHSTTISGTVDADVSVTLATYSVLDGDRWVIVCADDGTGGTRQIATWAIDWSVT